MSAMGSAAEFLRLAINPLMVPGTFRDRASTSIMTGDWWRQAFLRQRRSKMSDQQFTAKVAPAGPDQPAVALLFHHMRTPAHGAAEKEHTEGRISR